MPLPPNFSIDRTPQHWIIRCDACQSFAASQDEIWNILHTCFRELSHKYTARLHCCVLMDNHLHFLLTSPYRFQSDILRFLIERLGTKSLNALDHKIIPIKNRQHFKLVYKYIYRNPVHAKIASRAQDYPYSTLRGLLGLSVQQIPVEDNCGLISDLPRRLSWINSPMPENWIYEEGQ